MSPATFAATLTDHDAIQTALDRWLKAWQVRDSELAAQDHSDDGDWTKAFGATRKGRTEIETILTEVFLMSSGAELGVRKTTNLRVFEKRSRQWQIIRHLISDARNTEQRGH